jgi:acetyl-CoA C-acetyltransferase
VVGARPEMMGIGPVPAIQTLLSLTGLSLPQIDRFEINEAFGAQVLACQCELGLDRNKLNVNGGAIAIGHPLGATGVRLAVTLAARVKAFERALRRCLGLHRRGIRHRIACRDLSAGN